MHLAELIVALKTKAIADSSGFWKRIAVDLERSTRARRIVNVNRIEKFAKENETIVIPGKVLADGILKKKVNVVAFSFSGNAKQKIMEAKGNTMTIHELMKKNPKTSELRIMG